MYAVIEHGGKQYRVTEGQTLNIELTAVAPDATAMELDKVLFIGNGEDIKLGTPYIEGAKVLAKFKTSAQEGIVKGPKLYPTHFRRRKNSQRRIGHRQKYLQIVVDKIEA